MLRHVVHTITILIARLALLISTCSIALASSPAITLSVSSGPPTTSLTVNGTGFGSSETVKINFDSTVVGSTTTNSTGGFTQKIKVPKSALPGNHSIQATGQSSGLSASATFLVQTNWATLGFNS